MFVDNDGCKNLSKIKKNYNFKYIKYIHFPYTFLIKKFYNSNEEILNYYKLSTEYSKKYSKGIWKLYYYFYKQFINFLFVNDIFEDADLVIVNSTYISRLIFLMTGKQPEVVYPPVDVESLTQYSKVDFSKREDSIAMIGRISNEKNFEEVIEPFHYQKLSLNYL